MAAGDIRLVCRRYAGGPRTEPTDKIMTSALAESVSALLWMGLPVVGGYIFWQLHFRRLEDGEAKASAIARKLSLLGIIGAGAPMMCLVVWIVPLPVGQALLLALVGILVHGAGSLSGWLAGRAAGVSQESRATYFLAGGSSNVLTFGAITVVLLLRSPDDPYAEIVLGEMALYRIFETPFYFLVVWPLTATIASHGQTGQVPFGALARRALRGPNMAPALGIFAGLALNATGVPRPHTFDGVAEILVRCTVIIFGVTVGIGLRRAAPFRHLRPCLTISVIKFLVMPLVGIGLANLVGFEGRTVQMIAIVSSMPVAFMAMVGATLYRLDVELVGSFWVFTTMAMVIVVPVLSALIGLVG